MEMDAAVSFGEVLKELRNRKKRSRPKLAHELHVSPSSIEKWERGDVLPDRARVEEMIRALELTEAERLLLLEAHAGHRILPSLHNIPAARNPYFTGREEVLAQLHNQLMPGGQVALTQAISGLGGIGKTQIALQYIYRFQKAYSHVLWATADSPASLVTEFVKLAHDLELPEKDEEDQSKIVRAMQRWLREYVDWLLIVDNIEDLNLISSFIPAGHLGSVLVTTRRQVTEPVAEAIVLDVLSEEEGAVLVLKRAKRLALDGSLESGAPEEVLVARTITQRLGGLPLALDQAGAYIAETRCSLSEYLELFKRERAVLLQRRGTVPSDHPQSVTTTFALAIEQVRQKNDAAIDLLKVCAFLAPDTIPLEIITEGADHLGAALEPVAGDALHLDQALETLQAYSLVQRDPKRKTLWIHRLVQAVLRDGMDEATSKLWIEHAVQAVNAALPTVEHKNWPQWERLLAQTQQCAQWIEYYDLFIEKAVFLLEETGWYIAERARYKEAEPLLERALKISEYVQGSEHLDTARAAGTLGWLYDKQGKYEQAEPLYQRALAIRERQLGAEHPDTAISLDNLAYIYENQGKYSEAEPLLRRALQIDEQQSGAEHPYTASSLNNLALLYESQGRYSEAEPLLQRALTIREKVLGPEHPETAEVMHGLARLREAQGNREEARNWYAQALAIHDQALGAHHPETMKTRKHFIALLHALGQHEEAAQLEENQSE